MFCCNIYFNELARRSGCYVVTSIPINFHGVIILPNPTPQRTMMEVQCLCLHDSKRNDEVAVPLCAQDYPTANDDGSAVPVPA